MTKPHYPEFKISRIIMSETLSPHHLHILQHLLAFFPTLKGIHDIVAAPPETIMESAKGEQVQPLFVFKRDDRMSPGDIAYMLLAENFPFFTLEITERYHWTYIFYHPDVRGPQGIIGQIPAYPTGTMSKTPKSSFYGFSLIAA